MRKEHGFTLIELLIVLAILGILVGIVAMSVGDLTTTAKNRGIDSEMEIVQTAIDTYNTQDVLVDGADAITECAVAATIPMTGGSVRFNKYLKKATKYTYAWDAEGLNLDCGDD